MAKYGDVRGVTIYFTIGKPLIFKVECNKNCIRIVVGPFSLGFMSFDIEQMLIQSLEMLIEMKEKLKKNK